MKERLKSIASTAIMTVIIFSMFIAGTTGYWTYKNEMLHLDEAYSIEKVKEEINKTEVTSEDAFTWDGDTITGLKEDVKDKYIVIPDRCTVINNFAFRGTEIEAIKVGKNVRKIGVNSFQNCLKLKYVYMDDSVKTLYGGTFNNCILLKEVRLSNSLGAIMDGTFYNCNKLDTLNKPESLKYIEESAFEECYSLSNLDEVQDGCIVSSSIPGSAVLGGN